MHKINIKACIKKVLFMHNLTKLAKQIALYNKKFITTIEFNVSKT